MNEPTSIAEIAESTSLIERVKAREVAKKASRDALKLVQKDASTEKNQLNDPAYLSRFLIQCTLPHTDPGNVPIWRRRNGRYTLRIQPGWDEQKDCSMGYPYGIMPRLILIWAVTEAKRTGIRRIELGHSMTEFIEKLDLKKPSGRGKRGTPTTIKEQAQRLFSSNIDFFMHTREIVEGKTILADESESYRVASKVHLRWGEKDPKQAVLWGSYIDLSLDFYHAITKSVVPFDMNHLKGLRKSPLALDLYMLCNYIGANLNPGQTKHLLTWRMLGQQLGCDYTRQDNLRTKIKAALITVKKAYKEIDVRYPSKGGGIEIYRSKPAIAPREKKDDRG